MNRFGECPRCHEPLRPSDLKYGRHLMRKSGGACGP